MKKIILSVVILAFSAINYAQVGIGTTTPNSSSVLDVVSTDKGFLMPRMTTAQRTAITTSAATAGLQVYDTVTKSVWYHDGTSWVESANATAAGVGKFIDGTPTATEAVYMDGNVGVGIANPDSKLHVKGGTSKVEDGNLYVKNGLGYILNDNNDPSLSFGLTNFSEYGYLGWDRGNDFFGMATKDHAYDIRFGNDYMAVKSDGNVGIGTTNPLAKLDVRGGVDVNNGYLKYTTYTNNGAVYYLQTRKARGTIDTPTIVQTGDRLGEWVTKAYDGSSFAFAAKIGVSTDGVVSAGDIPTKMTFSTRELGTVSYSQRMVIKNDGNVGIGTTEPASALHISKSTVGAQIYLTNTDGTLGGSYPSITATAYNAGHSGFIGERAGGTKALPTVAPQNVTLNTMVGRGYDGTSFTEAGRISILSGTNYDASNNDGQIHFQVRKNNVANNAMVIKETGNVGIGTTSPNGKLHVSGEKTNAFVVRNVDTDDADSDGDMTTGTMEDTFVGIGTNTPTSMLQVESASSSRPNIHLNNTSGNNRNAFLTFSGESAGQKSSYSIFQWSGGQVLHFSADDNGTNKNLMRLWKDTQKASFYGDIETAKLVKSLGAGNNYFSGNVGIGTTSPAEKLHVNGKIRTATSIYADYVFEEYYNGYSDIKEDYSFKSLAEVDNFIRVNKHLPGITSIKDIPRTNEGLYSINITDLSVQLLEKVEELYLHTIEQEKEIIKLRKENKSLKAVNSAFNNRLEIIEKHIKR